MQVNPLVEDRVALTRQVKEASDIVAVVGSYISVQPAGAGFKAVCPFHDDTRPSLQIDPRWQNFKCWACGKKGDVFTFVMEMDKVDFLEAREILARRANIALDSEPGPNLARLKLLDAMRWAEGVYRECLIDSPLAEQARIYLGERKLDGAMVREFGLGFAPLSGEWLREKAREDGQSWETLLEVGLLGERKEKQGFYDRFRERVMFPIRDMRGQTVGFGGRILPASAYATRSPKYYNSSDTPLFNKSELLYGLDRARQAGSSEGFLAVVEGYPSVRCRCRRVLGRRSCPRNLRQSGCRTVDRDATGEPRPLRLPARSRLGTVQKGDSQRGGRPGFQAESLAFERRVSRHRWNEAAGRRDPWHPRSRPRNAG
ncbi:MAG: hypothetical protein K8T89_08060 [Planctomycetes bacterium]|nr:hypothetical protein [Planctomycetota bacterium]